MRGGPLGEAPHGSDWLGAVLSAYAPFPGAYDEMMRPDGSMRPPWDRFFARIGALGPEAFREAFDNLDKHLRDSGVVFRSYDSGSGSDRAWPLTPVPLVIAADEWAALKAGVIQRARVVEAVLADVYGEGRLTREGVLPAAVIAGSPNYLRPLVGVVPRGRRHLRFYAVDIGRSPEGRWWVLSDRTQAPSGAGYALENRLAIGRALPEVSRALNVDRLAGFFQAFRDELHGLNSGAEARVGLLTPGVLNETYFEHAYLARYLGFLLVEGGDLTVRDDALYVRTVSGLKRIDVLWRRLDGDFCDPLELMGSSQLGVAGLAQAIRSGSVAVANALGSGVMESRALMGFMPALSRRLFDEDLALPNMATWWCGQAKERDVVLAGLDRMAIASAFTGRLAETRQFRVVGSTLTPAERAAVVHQIETRGLDVVGQEDVSLSTMPVWDGEKLMPKPFVLRLFVAAVGEDDWVVMPGGFCRISGTDDARYVSMQEDGARTADVWVLSDGPVSQTSLLPRPETIPVRRSTGTLPSRSADNLFWLARYLERTEQTLRLADATLSRLIEADGAGDSPLVQGLIGHLVAIGALDGEAEGSPATLAPRLLTDPAPTSGLPYLTLAARNAGAVIRDRLAPDAFQLVMELAERYAPDRGRRRSLVAALDEVNAGLRDVAAFSGLAAENMNRAMGWRFVELGRRIERGLATARFVRRFAVDDGSPDALDLALELGDSQITYRGRYVMHPARHPTLDLLLFDEANPRSVAFQCRSIVAHLEALPTTASDGRPSDLLREAHRLYGQLADTPVEKLRPTDIDRMTARLTRLYGLISERFFNQRPTVLQPEELE